MAKKKSTRRTPTQNAGDFIERDAEISIGELTRLLSKLERATANLLTARQSELRRLEIARGMRGAPGEDLKATIKRLRLQLQAEKR